VSISTFPILTLVTFLPLIGALVVAVAPERYARGLALATALATWILSLPPPGSSPAAPRPALPVRRRGAVDPGVRDQFKLGVDGLSLILVVLTTTLWISILSSFAPIKDRIKLYMMSFSSSRSAHRGFRRARPVPLHLLGDRPRPDVPDHRDLGRQQPDLRDGKFVLYTLVGSLRCSSRSGDRLAQSATGSWDNVRLRVLRNFATQERASPAGSAGRVLAFFLAFAIRSRVPVPYLAAGRPRRGPDGRLRDPSPRSC
jgi:hypothetical protein